MRKYEVMFIIRPDLPEEDANKLITQMEGVVAGAGGKVEKVDKMGHRRLAYRVKKNREGVYVLFTLEGGGDTVKELERRLKVTDAVIKFMTVRIDEELKRAAKRKALRAEEEARRPKSKPAGPAPGPGPAAPPVLEPGAQATGA
jgi:small subunit ribosomal protein S6